MDQTGRILAILKSVSKKRPLPGPDESLFDSGFLDSFALPDMVSELEKQFGIRVPDADLNPGKFDTLARIDRYVAKALAARKV